MDKKSFKKLMSKVSIRRYVALHFFNDIDAFDKKLHEEFLMESAEDIIRKTDEWRRRDCVIKVNVNKLHEDNVLAGQFLMDKFNSDLPISEPRLQKKESNLIEDVLIQLNRSLINPALVVFYLFKDPESTKEKIILTSIRQFIETREYTTLGILIISSGSVLDWNLEHYSPLDYRDVEIFYYKLPELTQENN